MLNLRVRSCSDASFAAPKERAQYYTCQIRKQIDRRRLRNCRGHATSAFHSDTTARNWPSSTSNPIRQRFRPEARWRLPRQPASQARPSPRFSPDGVVGGIYHQVAVVVPDSRSLTNSVPLAGTSTYCCKMPLVGHDTSTRSTVLDNIAQSKMRGQFALAEIAVAAADLPHLELLG